MKSLTLGIVRASASSALAYSRLCSGNPFACRRFGGPSVVRGVSVDLGWHLFCGRAGKRL
ncbi:MAG: hypothetical protein LBQ31_08955 [Bacteroidales bacterium]|nr:hypothetical protein [Bacteroidales bacterium]